MCYNYSRRWLLGLITPVAIYFVGGVFVMAELLTQLGLVGTEVIEYVGTVCTTIVGQPLLLLTVGFLFIGGVVGIFGRLLSRG